MDKLWFVGGFSVLKNIIKMWPTQQQWGCSLMAPGVGGGGEREKQITNKWKKWKIHILIYFTKATIKPTTAIILRQVKKSTTIATTYIQILMKKIYIIKNEWINGWVSKRVNQKMLKSHVIKCRKIFIKFTNKHTHHIYIERETRILIQYLHTEIYTCKHFKFKKHS